MFAICLESSHKKGMGHLFRMLTFAKYLTQKAQKIIFIINEHEKTKEILELNKYEYEIANLKDITSDWESTLNKTYNFRYWINDRLDTNINHVKNVLKNNIKIITFDDLGSGATESNLNICGLFFNENNLKGKKVLRGIQYLILNPEINNLRKKRNEFKKVIVSFGGSDTYGVTVKVLKLLKKYHINASIHIGPSFQHHEDLNKELTKNYKTISFVPSFIKELSKYDLAITGGGITPFEANYLGIPSLIVANEPHEINNGRFLEKIGSSYFLGFHTEINETYFRTLKTLDLEKLSSNAISKLKHNALEEIFKEINNL